MKPERASRTAHFVALGRAVADAGVSRVPNFHDSTARVFLNATLADLVGRSAAGSRLIVNYHTGNRRLFSQLILRLIGEPQISAWTPEQMASDLESVGVVVAEDSSMNDWNKRFAQGQGRVDRGSYMRIAIARR